MAESVGVWQHSLAERFVERENVRNVADGWGTAGEAKAAGRVHGRVGRPEAAAEVSRAGRLQDVKKPRLFPTRHRSA